MITYGCIRFIDSYSSFSSSLDLLVEKPIDNSNETLKILKEESFDNDEISNFFTEIENESRTIDDLTKYDPDKSEKLEEVLKSYISEKVLKLLKTEIPNKWKSLGKKLAYPYEFFNSAGGYQKLV